MQKFYFDMKDGVPHRDTVGTEFKDPDGSNQVLR